MRATLLGLRTAYNNDRKLYVVRRLFRPIERFVLGTLMTLIAIVVERRLRARRR